MPHRMPVRQLLDRTCDSPRRELDRRVPAAGGCARVAADRVAVAGGLAVAPLRRGCVSLLRLAGAAAGRRCGDDGAAEETQEHAERFPRRTLTVEMAVSARPDSHSTSTNRGRLSVPRIDRA